MVDTAPIEGVRCFPGAPSLFEGGFHSSSFEDKPRTSSNEDRKNVMPEEFTLTGRPKLGAPVRDTRFP